MDHPFLIAGLAYLAGHDAAVAREAAAREAAEAKAIIASVQAEALEDEAEYERITGRRKKQNEYADMGDWLSDNFYSACEWLSKFFCFIFFVVCWVRTEFLPAVLLTILSPFVCIPAAVALLLVGKLVCWIGARRWYEDIPPDGSADLNEEPEEQAEHEEVMGIIAATSGDHEAVTEEESGPTTKETSPDDTFLTIVGAVTILAFIVGWVLSGSFWWAVLSFCTVWLLFALIDKFRKPEP
jgi:membrane protein implicated in regulation of membrane protease activity